jgi:hypothetical protein
MAVEVDQVIHALHPDGGRACRSGVRTISSLRRNVMTTHAELAARLLREAAVIFRTAQWGDASLQERLAEFSRLYDRVADLVESEPTRELQPSEIDVI